MRDLGAVGIFNWILFDLGDRTAGSVLHSEVGAHLTTGKNRFLSSEYSSSLILVCTLLNHSTYIFIYIYKSSMVARIQNDVLVLRFRCLRLKNNSEETKDRYKGGEGSH